MFRIFLLACVVSLAAFPALAEKRTAFIVGNADYANAGRLANPVNDARLVANTLEGLGFDVALAADLTRAELAAEFSAFLDRTEGADVTLFYYAGHGMQFEGQNYLLGVDAALRSTFDVQSEALPLNRIVQMLEERARAALVFIDACRDNPLATEFYTQNFSPTRALTTRGLAPMAGRFQGSMLMFAASPGQVAYDGASGNSPFTQALAKHLPTENVEILTLMKRVIRDVKSDTDDKQVPTVTNDLALEVYLKLGEGGEGSAIAAAQEEAIFEAALAINTERAWDIYLKRFPMGSMRDLALAAREELTAAALASAPGSVVAESGQITVARDTAAFAEQSLGLSKEDARAVQAALNARGYDAGPEDSVIGARTRRAIADFQAAAGLPSTGVVTAGTADALNVEFVVAETSTVPIVSSSNARRYDPKTLALLETDPRLLKAATALAGKEFVYGYYEDRLFVGVLTWCCSRSDEANALAERSGGHLATLTTPEENDFVFRLVKDDKRFWRDHGDNSYVGPTFGLHQTEGAREPDGGWGWVTGEPADWIPWFLSQPNNSGEGQAVMAAFFNEPPIPNNRWADAHVVHTGIIIEVD